VLARGKWSPLTVGSSEGVARIWIHLACREARGTTRVQDRVRTPRWRTGRMVPDTMSGVVAGNGLYVRVGADAKQADCIGKSWRRRSSAAPNYSSTPRPPPIATATTEAPTGDFAFLRCRILILTPGFYFLTPSTIPQTCGENVTTRPYRFLRSRQLSSLPPANHQEGAVHTIRLV
jgi:hypothetical protein